MFRKSVILASFATLLAAGSAFAATTEVGTVRRIDVANGNIWLANGTEFGVGRTVAEGLLPGDKVSVSYTDINNSITVLDASPVS